MGFKNRYEAVCLQLEKSAAEAGRSAAEVKVIAVSKTVGVPQVREAVAAGAHDFGENRIELLAEKADALPNENWHFIGNIQSRKISSIVAYSQMIHSLYQESHLGKIDAAAAALGKVQDVLIEVNVSGEESKSGLEPALLAPFLERAQGFEHVRLRGLMTMAPALDADAAARCFEGLRLLRDKVRGNLDEQHRAAFTELSMGMSGDWPQAVAEGATMVRIGRALFDEGFRG